MELIKIKSEIKNAPVFLIILGIWIFPAIDALASVVNGLLSVIIDATLGTQIIIVIYLEVFVCLVLIFVTYLLVKKGNDTRSKLFIHFTGGRIKFIAIVLFVILIAGRFFNNLSFRMYGGEQVIDLLADSSMVELAKKRLLFQMISILKSVLLLVILLIIGFQNRKTSITTIDKTG